MCHVNVLLYAVSTTVSASVYVSVNDQCPWSLSTCFALALEVGGGELGIEAGVVRLDTCIISLTSTESYLN